MIRLLEDVPVHHGEVLKLAGEVDFRSTPSFRTLLQTKAKSLCPLLFLDCSDVTYIDSGGMSALIEYWRDSQAYGGIFALIGLNDRLQEIFHIVHLDEHLLLFPTWDEAWAVFAPEA